jgi:hypothetical protein
VPASRPCVPPGRGAPRARCCGHGPRASGAMSETGCESRRSTPGFPQRSGSSGRHDPMTQLGVTSSAGVTATRERLPVHRLQERGRPTQPRPPHASFERLRPSGYLLWCRRNTRRAASSGHSSPKPLEWELEAHLSALMAPRLAVRFGSRSRSGPSLRSRA